MKPNGIMQTEQEAVDGTMVMIDSLIGKAAESAKAGEYDDALKSLGQASHTIQDADQHGFEAWEYDGIWDAFFSDPIGIIVHGIKDLFLGSDEKKRNVGLTQSVFERFKQAAGQEAFDNTMNYEGQE